jgi:hypothetical protein
LKIAVLCTFVNNLPLIFFYPRICFYGETGNEAEADEDHQRGREKGWNENEGVLQTVGNDKDINTKNEKGYRPALQAGKNQTTSRVHSFSFPFSSGCYYVECLRNDFKRNGGFPEDFTITE